MDFKGLHYLSRQLVGSSCLSESWITLSSRLSSFESSHTDTESRLAVAGKLAEKQFAEKQSKEEGRSDEHGEDLLGLWHARQCLVEKLNTLAAASGVVPTKGEDEMLARFDSEIGAPAKLVKSIS